MVSLAATMLSFAACAEAVTLDDGSGATNPAPSPTMGDAALLSTEAGADQAVALGAEAGDEARAEGDAGPAVVLDAGTLVDGGPTCKDFADPAIVASCACKAKDASACQANGCYGGYVCYTTQDQCWASKPAGCP
jgi:hypothetical protein